MARILSLLISALINIFLYLSDQKAKVLLRFCKFVIWKEDSAYKGSYLSDFLGVCLWFLWGKWRLGEVIVMIYWNTMKYTMKRVRRPAFVIWSSRGWRLFQSKNLYSLSEFLAKAYIRLQLIKGFAARYWCGKQFYEFHSSADFL